ncbi:hypothetical protein T439DRAFT_85302 [Meredithblackwellia eburnea MCA 4105]
MSFSTAPHPSASARAPPQPPPPSLISSSDSLPNPLLHRQIFPLLNNLMDSPEFSTTLAQLPVSKYHGSINYPSYREKKDESSRRRHVSGGASSQIGSIVSMVTSTTSTLASSSTSSGPNPVVKSHLKKDSSGGEAAGSPWSRAEKGKGKAKEPVEAGLRSMSSEVVHLRAKNDKTVFGRLSEEDRVMVRPLPVPSDRALPARRDSRRASAHLFSNTVFGITGNDPRKKPYLSKSLEHPTYSRPPSNNRPSSTQAKSQP